MSEKMHLAKLKKDGHEFEVSVDADLAMKFKKGEDVDIREVVKSENVFTDAKKGDLASESLMNEIFETSQKMKVIETIIRDGEIQLTSEYRDRKREEKKRKIITMIQQYAVDPRNGNPHPATRIENALREAKVHIDENKSAEDQVKDIVHKMKPILPIKFEIKQVQVHLSAEYAAKTYGTLQRYGTLLKDEWLNDGSWMGVIEIPGGLEADLYEKLNDATKGTVETKVINTK